MSIYKIVPAQPNTWLLLEDYEVPEPVIAWYVLDDPEDDAFTATIAVCADGSKYSYEHTAWWGCYVGTYEAAAEEYGRKHALHREIAERAASLRVQA